MKVRLLTNFLIILPLLAGCASRREMLPTAVASPTPEPTATVDWFPKTPTATQLPTLEMTPTPNMLGGVGEVVIRDDFSDPTLWTSLKRPSGLVVVSPGELAISVSGPNGYLFSQRNSPALQDDYLEATLKTSLCQGGDAFGLLIRTTTFQDYYRWLINCDGFQRLERVRAGNVAVLQDWIASDQVLPGAPQSFRLGVLSRGNELLFFINDLFQFSVRDDAFQGGGIGVFARSSGDSQLSVGFQNILIHNLEGELPIATPAGQQPSFTLSKTPSK